MLRTTLEIASSTSIAPRDHGRRRRRLDVDHRVRGSTALIGDRRIGDVGEIDPVEPRAIGELGVGQRPHRGQRGRHPLQLIVGKAEHLGAVGVADPIAAGDVEIGQRTLQWRAQFVGCRRGERTG